MNVNRNSAKENQKEGLIPISTSVNSPLSIFSFGHMDVLEYIQSVKKKQQKKTCFYTLLYSTLLGD